MKLKIHLVPLAALPLLLGASGYAQKPAESKQAVEPTRDATDVLTVIGCVQRESDYRTAIGEGKGGVAGTGLGDSREFVLRAVRTVSTNLVPISKPAKIEEVYRMTGKLESELSKVGGHQVAVSGYVKVKETNGTNKVGDLPDMVVIGWHSISDSCKVPAKSSK